MKSKEQIIERIKEIEKHKNEYNLALSEAEISVLSWVLNFKVNLIED